MMSSGNARMHARTHAHIVVRTNALDKTAHTTTKKRAQRRERKRERGERYCQDWCVLMILMMQKSYKLNLVEEASSLILPAVKLLS
jgi:hypothetical protein